MTFLAAPMQRSLRNLNFDGPVVHVGCLHCMLLRTISVLRMPSMLSALC
jgi:hypothetical protein